MKNWVWVVPILAVGTCFAQSARNYYNELYAAGALGKIISDRVCFDDRPELETFFMFTESKLIREVMIADGSFSKAPKTLQTQLKRDLLIFRGYDKGVPIEDEEDFTPDHDSWISERFMIDKTPARIRFDIVWETLRYKRSVELLNPDGTFHGVVSAYGRCEVVSPAVRQHGK